MLNSLPSAYIVHFKLNGVPRKSVFLERPRAEEYAIKYHGILKGLYELNEAIVLPQELVNNIVSKEMAMIIEESK